MAPTWFTVIATLFAGSNARMFRRGDYWDMGDGLESLKFYGDPHVFDMFDGPEGSAVVPSPVAPVEIHNFNGGNAMYGAVAQILGKGLEDDGSGDYWTDTCSGTSIVPPDGVTTGNEGLFVLTAAHCVWDDEVDQDWETFEDLKVYFGVHDGNVKFDTPNPDSIDGVISFEVEEAFIPIGFPDAVKRMKHSGYVANEEYRNYAVMHVMYDYGILRLKPRADGKTPPHSLPLGVFEDKTQETTLFRAGYSEHHKNVYGGISEYHKEKGHLTVFPMKYIKDDLQVNPPGADQFAPDMNPLFGDKNKGLPVLNFIFYLNRLNVPQQLWL